MPIYEYACPKCKAEFELLVRGSETPECPECGGSGLEKLLSVPATPAMASSDPCHAAAPSGGCGMGSCGSGGCPMQM